MTDAVTHIVNFVLLGMPSSSIKRSLRTHCPIMIREHCEGHYFDEEICRCDVKNDKKRIHPRRCSSKGGLGGCPVREHVVSREKDVPRILESYELL